MESADGAQIHDGIKGPLYKGTDVEGGVLIHNVIGSYGVAIKNGALTTFASAGSVTNEFGNTSSGIVYKLPTKISGDVGIPFNGKFKGFRVTVTGNVNTTVQNTSSFIETSVGSYYEVKDLGNSTYSLDTDLSVVKAFTAYKNFDTDEINHPSITDVPVNSTFIIPIDDTFTTNPAMNLDDGLYLRFLINAWNNDTTYINNIKIEAIFAADFDIDFGGAALAEAINDEGKLTAKMNVTAVDSGSAAKLLLGIYEKASSQLVGVAVSNQDVSENTPTELTATLQNLSEVKADADNYFVRAFLWSGTDTMTPLTDNNMFLGR